MPLLDECPHCHQPKRQHHVCPNCGYYAGRQAIEMKKPGDERASS
jgi:large subunit ribosomal protein L32